jgi:hypothetical protein
MQLHVRSGVRPCECSAEGSFGEERKLQRVIFLSSPNPNRSLHQSTPLSASPTEHWNFRLWPLNGGLPVLPAVDPERTVANGSYREAQFSAVATGA